MKLKLRVGSLMKDQKMSVQNLADKADIAPGTARALQRGVITRLDIPVLEKVAAALGVRPLELFEEVEGTPGQRRPDRKAA